MTKEASTISGALVTGNFTINATMPNGKSIVVSGYLYEGESIESVNQRVSLFDDIVDFQRTRSEIHELELKYKASISRLEDIKLHYSVILGKKERGEKLSSQEKSALDVMDVNIKKHNEDLLEGAEAIAVAKRKVGVA
jgi:hypothetical protein